MNVNELQMKRLGERQVWKGIMTKDFLDTKKASSTQIGKRLLLDEGLRIFDDVKVWISTGCAKMHRKAYKNYFTDDEILLVRIVEVMLLLSGDIKQKGESLNRHRKIQTLQDKLMPELGFDEVWRVVEVIVDYSSYFHTEREMDRKGETYRWRLNYRCTLSETIIGKLTIEAAEAFYPQPMLVKPIDWTYDPELGITGGYEDYQYEMVRSPSGSQIEYEPFSKKIYNSLNYIQSTPWVINKVVLAQLKRDLSVPKKSDFIHTEFPEMGGCVWEKDLEEDVEMSEEKKNEIIELRLRTREQIELYNAEKGDYESAVGKYRAVKLAVGIADRYKDEEVLYFPHSYDFRGRIYPLPVGLSPQGSDAVKALLLYKEVEAPTSAGTEWNWAYLASLYGDDKLPFEERVERGKDLIDADYMEADEPYQFLSHQIELNEWENDRMYTPNTRIHLDACNSGSQFTSAITGDKAGCLATNVMPTYDEDGEILRQDAYMLVAQKSIEETKKRIIQSNDKAEREILEFLRDLLSEHGRKICKQPTMVSNYGGTAQGRAEILWQMFRELKCEHKWITKKNAALFSKIIGDSIQGVLNGGKAFEVYVQRMCNLISRGDCKVTWTTDDGFYVEHKKNKELKSRQILCTLPGSRSRVTISKKTFSKRVSPAKMRSAISPNYIHALDAELLRRVAMKMKKAGIENSDWIHDSYGCHPNYVDVMLDITKEEFNKLIKRKPLYTLDKELRAQVSGESKIQKELSKVEVPSFRGFDLEKGIDELKNSDWFFS